MCSQELLRLGWVSRCIVQAESSTICFCCAVRKLFSVDESKGSVLWWLLNICVVIRVELCFITCYNNFISFFISFCTFKQVRSHRQFLFCSCITTYETNIAEINFSPNLLKITWYEPLEIYIPSDISQWVRLLLAHAKSHISGHQPFISVISVTCRIYVMS
jgi:hypothetical protein